MNPVSEIEFNNHIEKLNAWPDGFKIVGSSIQTKFFVNGIEIARRTTDGFGTQYEIC